MRRAADRYRRFVLTPLAAMLLPLAGGLAVFGWRAAAVVAIVLVCAGAGSLVWRRVGLRGNDVRRLETLWAAGLVALMLPADLASPTGWPVAAAAGLLVPAGVWLLGGPCRGRISAAAAVVVLVWAAWPGALRQDASLTPSTAWTGDVLRAGAGAAVGPRAVDWRRRMPSPGFDAVRQEPPAEAVARGVSGHRPIEAVVRDDLPPLQDVVGLGRPGPIGASQAAAVVVAGLLLVRLGNAEFRLPLAAGIGAYAAALVLPVAGVWAWPRGQAWDVALTFVHYELAGGAILFTIFLLAAQPGVRPIAPRARLPFGLCLGVLALAGQRHVSPDVGPYLALLALGPAAGLFERAFGPRPLVSDE